MIKARSGTVVNELSHTTRKMLLFSITSCSTLLWSVVNCNKTVIPITAGVDRNYTAMMINFEAKYISKSYCKWQKLHKSEPKDLETVCKKFAGIENIPINVKVEVEATRSYHNIHYLVGHFYGTAEIDTLACLVKFMHKNGTESSRMTYYLTEGHELDSAFRFTLLRSNIELTHYLTNIWSKESKPPDFHSTKSEANATEVTTTGDKSETTKAAVTNFTTIETTARGRRRK